MKSLCVALACVCFGCATTPPAPVVESTAQAVSAPVERHAVKLVVKDQRLGTDSRLANQLEGYVRNKLEAQGVKVDQAATQIFEINAMPPDGRCSLATGRVFPEGGEAFAFPVKEQRCAAAPGNPLLGADALSAAVAAAYTIIASLGSAQVSDFQHAVDALVVRLVLKVR